jgi:hypothetical protein
MEGIRYAVERILGGEQGRGYQAARVEKKLDQLAAKGKLEQHTVREVRRMLEAEFEKERIEVQKLGVLALETPSRQVMDPVIKKRLVA